MKKVVIAGLSALALSVAGTDAQAQTHVAKINIFSPIFSTASLFYEQAVSVNKSAQLGFFYTGASLGDVKFRGFGVTPEFRFYLSDSKEAPRGAYLGPFLRYQSFTLSSEYTNEYTVINPDGSWGTETEDVKGKATLSTFGGGVVVGHQWLLKDRISIDVFGGPSYNAGSIKVKDGADEEKFSGDVFDGFGFRTGVTLGVAF